MIYMVYFSFICSILLWKHQVSGYCVENWFGNNFSQGQNLDLQALQDFGLTKYSCQNVYLSGFYRAFSLILWPSSVCRVF